MKTTTQEKRFNIEGISFPSPPLPLLSPTNSRLPSPSALFSRPPVSAAPCGSASRAPVPIVAQEVGREERGISPSASAAVQTVTNDSHGGKADKKDFPISRDRERSLSPASSPTLPSAKPETSFLALLAAAAQMDPKKKASVLDPVLGVDAEKVALAAANGVPAVGEGRKEELVVRVVSSPPSNELVARKTIKFSVMMTGDDAHLHGGLYLAAVLVDAKTLKPIPSGLMEKKVKLKRDPSSRPPQDAILQRIVPYRETGIEFQIVKGSAKKNIQNQIKFELRLYKGPTDSKNYEVMDSDFSAAYRILTHSSQLGRNT
eukprot:CAMPEP_0201536516 /NCGR_PEP_ID=MMETSP0161_2-20130828/62043_1 /ASSEMBLY_ACC=CAM_ASM_000251 /TAXON_ID=180227 /ORGANISM="Neoparamoeba aestuarina, Strain SoJaBio B1-5/56/2" /LENGTH=316 /DNA_ID=CAMNT_0047942261 /DNA_START=165 /DNA_END=1115 /DNA_ORIENTATION=+